MFHSEQMAAEVDFELNVVELILTSFLQNSLWQQQSVM